MKKIYLLLLIIPLLFACDKEEDNDKWGLKRTIWISVSTETKSDGTTVEHFFEFLFSETSFRATSILTLLNEYGEEEEVLDSYMWVGAYWMEEDEVVLNYKIEVEDEEGEMVETRISDFFTIEEETMEGVFDGYELTLTKSGIFEFDSL